MPHPHRRRFSPKPDPLRALEFLAAAPDGCTEALMFANGFTAELLIELVCGGLASAHAERMLASGRPMEVTRGRIHPLHPPFGLIDTAASQLRR